MNRSIQKRARQNMKRRRSSGWATKQSIWMLSKPNPIFSPPVKHRIRKLYRIVRG